MSPRGTDLPIDYLSSFLRHDPTFQSLVPGTEQAAPSPLIAPLSSLMAAFTMSLSAHRRHCCCFPADSCIYKKVCPFNAGSLLVQPSASDFQFCWNQAPYAIGKHTLCAHTVAFRAPSPLGSQPANSLLMPRAVGTGEPGTLMAQHVGDSSGIHTSVSLTYLLQRFLSKIEKGSTVSREKRHAPSFVPTYLGGIGDLWKARNHYRSSRALPIKDPAGHQGWGSRATQGICQSQS